MPTGREERTLSSRRTQKLCLGEGEKLNHMTASEIHSEATIALSDHEENREPAQRERYGNAHLVVIDPSGNIVYDGSMLPNSTLREESIQ